MTGLPGQTGSRGYAAAVRLLLSIRSNNENNELLESEDRI
jgi:hypothetical protein